MKRLFVALAALGLGSVWALGQGEAEQGQKHEGHKGEHKGPAVEMKDMTVTGTLQKNETEKEGTKHAHYTMTNEAGDRIVLPMPKAGAEGAADLDKYVGKQVTVTGKGTERAGKDGKKFIMISKIDKIEEAAAPATAQPAAQPAATEPAAEPAK